MNRVYLILPVVLMAVFAFFYSGASKEAAQREKAKQAEVEKKKQEELSKKEELNRKAALDAEKRTQERIKEDEEREKKRIAKYEDAIQKLKDDLKRYTDQIESNTKKVTIFERDLTALRARREKETRENLELAKKVELTKIARQNAELEVQRYTEMLSRRAAESAMTKSPLVTATP